MARRLIAPREFPRYQQFVDSYTRAHPLQDLDFMRASVVELWSQSSPADVKLVDSLGTIFMHGQMPANMRTAIVNHVMTLTDPAQRVRVAILCDQVVAEGHFE